MVDEYAKMIGACPFRVILQATAKHNPPLSREHAGGMELNEDFASKAGNQCDCCWLSLDPLDAGKHC